MDERSKVILAAVALARDGQVGAAIAVLETNNADPFEAAYAYAVYLSGAMAGPGAEPVCAEVVDMGPEAADEKARENAELIAAFLAAAGNGDVAGASLLFHNDAAASGRLLVETLMLAGQLAGMDGR